MQSQTYAQAGLWVQTSLALGNVCMILFRFTLKLCSCFHLAWTANQASQGTEIWIKHEEEVVQRGRWADADTCRRIFSNQSLMIVDIMELWSVSRLSGYIPLSYERVLQWSRSMLPMLAPSTVSAFRFQGLDPGRDCHIQWQRDHRDLACYDTHTHTSR